MGLPKTRNPVLKLTAQVVYNVVQKTATCRRRWIPCIVVEKIQIRLTFNTNFRDLLIAITNTKIVSDKKTEV